MYIYTHTHTYMYNTYTKLIKIISNYVHIITNKDYI